MVHLQPVGRIVLHEFMGYDVSPIAVKGSTYAAGAIAYGYHDLNLEVWNTEDKMLGLPEKFRSEKYMTQ